MEEGLEEKKGGCFSQGCGTLVFICVLLFIGNLLCDGDTDDTPSQERPTPAPTEIVTSPPAEVEPIEPPLPEETPIEPLPEEPSDEPQQPEEEPAEPPPTEVETTELVEAVKEVPKSDELITRSYVWEYGGEWSWDVQIPEVLYEYYQGIPRPPTRDYSVYVTHPLDDTYIGRLVEIIEESAAQKGLDEYHTIEFAIAFVQSLLYTIDSVTSPFDEYPRFPVETLVDGGGDCEDTSILLASLLDEMGYGVVLLGLPDHMAVGVKGGDNIYGHYFKYGGSKYYYIETTGSGWGIGDLPEEYEGCSAHVYAMNPAPIITHEWSAGSGGSFLELQVVVSNIGSGTASNVVVMAGYDAGNDKLWNPAVSDTFDLEVGMKMMLTMHLRPPPPDIHTRLVVQVGMGGYNVSESHSVWVDT